MKTSIIRIGSIYAMKVGKNTVGVRIMSQDAKGGYIGININTNKEVVIRSPERLCGLYNPKPGRKKEPSDQVEIKTNELAAPTGSTESKSKKVGGLDAAVKVLEEAGIPLRCKELVKWMIDKEYWQTRGKTPSQTIYSAIIREIAEKGTASRFRKAERGKFELNR